ncbi:mandelate racemase/muconate lactonizing enzyme family protein [Chloroflexota bacterium]
MKIVGIELTPITIEWEKPVLVSFGFHGKGEPDLIVEIFTDDGISGVGEAMTLGPLYSRESQGTVMAILTEQIAPQVLLGEDPFNIDLIHHKMNRVVSEHSIAKTAVDVALHDIMGKALNIPVYKLIGGSHTDKLALHWAVGIETTEDMVATALRGTKAGFGTLKVKIGSDPKQDVANVRAIREAAGPDIPIFVDANMGYDVKTAIRTIKQMEEFDIQRVEQPVHYRDLDGMATVRRAVDVPIGACESALTMFDVVQIIRKEAADFLNFKVMRSGGFYPSKAIVQMASAAGIFCTSSTQLGMGIEVATDAHFATSTIDLAPPPYSFHGITSGIQKVFWTMDSSGITKDIVDDTPTIAKGFLTVPQAPGLGVNLNRENLNSYLTKGKKPVLIGEKP